MIYRNATSSDLKRCFEIRGQTQDNAFNESELAAIGVTEESWFSLNEDGTFTGNVASTNNIVIGFCFGGTKTGEILVLAVLKGHEGIGIGKSLLEKTSADLFSIGHNKLWLAASATPIVRAYGFYRSVGWHPTNTFDGNGDEILTKRKI
jgi:ribosomal protein S18 acetylase RimI-like enzyme